MNPWALARGDPDANLTNLIALPEAPEEEVASKIYMALSDHTVARARIIEGVKMLPHVSHSIRVCEQLHAAASNYARYNDESGLETVRVRSGGNFIHQLFPAPSKLQRQVEMRAARLHRLGRKNANMLRSNSLYCRDLCSQAACKQRAGDTRFRSLAKVNRTIFKRTKFSQLSVARRRQCSQELAFEREKLRDENSLAESGPLLNWTKHVRSLRVLRQMLRRHSRSMPAASAATRSRTSRSS